MRRERFFHESSSSDGAPSILGGADSLVGNTAGSILHCGSGGNRTISRRISPNDVELHFTGANDDSEGEGKVRISKDYAQAITSASEGIAAKPMSTTSPTKVADDMSDDQPGKNAAKIIIGRTRRVLLGHCSQIFRKRHRNRSTLVPRRLSACVSPSTSYTAPQTFSLTLVTRSPAIDFTGTGDYCPPGIPFTAGRDAGGVIRGGTAARSPTGRGPRATRHPPRPAVAGERKAPHVVAPRTASR